VHASNFGSLFGCLSTKFREPARLHRTNTE
jgi:hypothetical protein